MKSWAWRLSLGIGLSLAITSCAYQGSIRYECQEFQNWEKPECVPPECEVAGVCSKDLVGDEIYDSKS